MFTGIKLIFDLDKSDKLRMSQGIVNGCLIKYLKGSRITSVLY